MKELGDTCKFLNIPQAQRDVKPVTGYTASKGYSQNLNSSHLLQESVFLTTILCCLLMVDVQTRVEVKPGQWQPSAYLLSTGHLSVMS